MLVGEFAPALRPIAWSQRKETYIACHHFCGAALLVLLVDPVAADEFSFDIDPHTLPKVCAYRFRNVSPHLTPVPRSLFLPLAKTVFVRLLGSQGKIRHDQTAFGMPDFGIPAESPRQHDFVDGVLSLEIPLVPVRLGRARRRRTLRRLTATVLFRLCFCGLPIRSPRRGRCAGPARGLRLLFKRCLLCTLGGRRLPLPPLFPYHLTSPN